MGRVKAYKERSRSGCSTCKKRRVKCDETRPVCLRCTKLNIDCEYLGVSLTWEDEADKRGITFGRSLKARSKKFGAQEVEDLHFCSLLPQREQYPFISTTVHDFESLGRDQRLHNTLNKNELESSLSIIFEKSLIPILNTTTVKFDAFDFIMDDTTPLSFDDIFLQSFAAFPISHLINAPEHDIKQFRFTLNSLERELVTYFIESIAPHCVCCEVKSNNTLNSYIAPELNPYLHLIVPLSFKFPHVMKAIVVASASQLYLIGRTEYKEVAQQYLVEVIEEIPQLLQRRKETGDWDDVFAVVIMLCFIEISVNCNNTWLALLNYAKQVLKESSGMRKNILSPVGKFFIRYFICHEVMGETAWAHDSAQGKPSMMEDDPFIEELKKDYDTKIDLVFGCSPYLISLIHRTSVIGQCMEDIKLEKVDRKLYAQEILKHAKETEDMVHSLKQVLPKNSELYFNEEERQNIFTIAEIKRLAALIYLHGVVYMHSSVDLSLKVDQTYDTDPGECTRRIIELQKNLPDFYMSLLWPIFVVGLVVAAEEEDVRWFVLDGMRQMERHRKLKTVQAAREIIINVWKERDLGSAPIHWKDVIKGKATTISLA